MKKLLSILLICLLLLPLFCALSFAESETLWVEMDVEQLWARKLEGTETHGGNGFGENVRDCHFILESNLLTPLLYTDAFQELEFELRKFDESDRENGADWLYAEDAQYLFLPHGYLSEYKGYCYPYSEELQQVLEETCIKNNDNIGDFLYIPYLRGCIEAFGITKEELRAACRESRENPDALRQAFADLSDEQFEGWKKSGKLESRLDESFLLDVLYLPDVQDVRGLCMHYFAANVSGTTILVDGFLSSTRYEWLKKQDLSDPGFYRFLQNAKNLLGWYYEDLEEEGLARIAELEQLATQPPPKAGDHTVAYMVIGLLAAAPCGATLAVLSKKRRAARL